MVPPFLKLIISMKKILFVFMAFLCASTLMAQGETSDGVIWENDGSHGEINWSGEYLFALEGHDPGNQCIAEFPPEVWDKIKTTTFYMDLMASYPQIRVTTGWWSTTWTGDDIYPGFESLVDNGDGTWTLAVNLTGNPLLGVIDEQGLLFTGGGYTPLKLYFDKNSGDGPTNKPYAILSDDNTVLTFYYDTKKEERGGMSVGPFTWVGENSWYNQASSITTVVFDDSFANWTMLASTAFWFYNCSNLTTITGIENLKTDYLTNMRRMFSGCTSLTSLNLSSFETDNVTNMEWMFNSCSSLTSLDLSSFKTDMVTDMSYMFSGCSSLTSLDLSSFKTDKVTNMHNMFSDCTSLKTLDVSGFKTSYVKDMGWMFSGCSSLTSLDLSSFRTHNVTDMTSMFCGCSGMTSLDVSGFKTNKVSDMSSMFSSCSSLTTIYAGVGWSTESVAEGGSMFYGSSSLVGGQGTVFDENHTDYTYARIDGGAAAPGYFTVKGEIAETPEPYAVLSDDNTVLTFYYDNQKEVSDGLSVGPFDWHSSWNDKSHHIRTVVFDDSFANCTSLTSTAYWFHNCMDLRTIEGIENLKTDNVTDMSFMFNACYGLTNLDVSGFKTDNVTYMSGMFSHCSSLTSLDLSNFKTDNVTDMSYMFRYCSSLTSLDLSNFKTDNVTNMGSMFSNSNLTSLDLSNFKTDNVTDMSYMFYYCPNLTTIYAADGWSTESVTNGNYMFYECVNLVGGQGTVFDSNHTDYTYARIDGGEAAPGYFTAKATSAEPSDIAIDAINFPDENFRNYLLSLNYGQDGVLTQEEIEGITRILVYGKNIQSLQGIEFFTALKYLYCYNNQLTSLDVSNNTALTRLDCNDNQLTLLDLSECTALTTLYCCGNKIKDEMMDALVSSLPTVEAGDIYLLMPSEWGESNECTPAQVAAANAKGWKVYQHDGSHWVEMGTYTPGDINGDGAVDVSDYIGIANHILGQTPQGFNAKAADVDGNGIIDVSDYIGVANIILTGSIYGSQQQSRISRHGYIE